MRCDACVRSETLESQKRRAIDGILIPIGGYPRLVTRTESGRILASTADTRKLLTIIAAEMKKPRRNAPDNAVVNHNTKNAELEEVGR